MSLKSLKENAQPYGLAVDSYQGRYKFSHTKDSYFAMSNDMRADSHKTASAFLDGYMSAIDHIKNAHLSDDEKSALGQAWAEILQLKKSREHKGRYLTTWGDKTALGIYAVMIRLVTGDLDTLP
jgi:hypothetical protein